MQALDIGTIRKIDRLQLLADSHDQGYADITSGGNWTWFELAILEDESAYKPRVKDGVDLVWKSHDNRFLEEEFGWVRLMCSSTLHFSGRADVTVSLKERCSMNSMTCYV